MISNNSETIIGDLLDLATVISPNLTKSWYLLANWSYKWAKKSADKIQSTNNEDNQSINILFDLLPSHTTNEEKDFILCLFSRGLNSINIPEILIKTNDEINNLKQDEKINKDVFSLE